MNQKAKIFNSLLDTFENNDIMEFACVCIGDIPDYFWDIGASSTGKYHPQYALGDLGLARHTCALVRFLNHFFSLEHFKNDFTSRERDLLRLAGILHDSRKSGDAESKSAFTVHEHPMLAANSVREYKDKFLTYDEIEYVASAICSHMGEWNSNKRSSIVLPKPVTAAEKILHLADYLASRKDIDMVFDNSTRSSEVTYDANTYTLSFGKYNGKTLPQIKEFDPDYVEWLKQNAYSEPLKSIIKNF